MTLQAKFYDKDGFEITFEYFTRLKLNQNYTFIKHETVNHKFLIALTWTGYTVSNNDPPLIYDITIFDLRNQARRNFHVEKAATLEEALEIYEHLKLNHPKLDSLLNK